ncbi:MAG: aspartate aminotransferase family protein [Xanthomonadales bacterium]|nr:aspartate aminotransferase family protein [Gammaproteobacteria bacterium]MBT8056693.1 aspartate aminotransferase family protein [Gammaproteobacteria bacterium]NNJ77933.1 aspartate aminotransferase family protein [Xanthomonadales bacterium]NNL03742.1 aspartate aminotransferase family protein [Xanthomonadales bacterium]
MTQHVMNTYARLPLAFERGEGAWLWDDEDRRYLDAISGLGVCALGHAHPELAHVIGEQAATLMHTSNLVRIPWQERLADKIADATQMDRVFFGNSGAEAIECALKIARLAGHRRGIDNPAVIVMKNSFHGRTLAALSATGNRKVQAGFEPLMAGFHHAAFGDVEAIEDIAANNRQVVALLMEPIQGEAGVNTPPAGYLQRLRQICDEQGWLLICDEIQSGLCRSGRWFAHQHDGIRPDVLTSAKALANGLPIGACVASGEAAKLMKPGSHGSTFGGNPLVTRAACTVLDIMKRDRLAQHAADVGQAMMTAFRDRLEEDPRVREIRGRGLMIGIELDRPAAAVMDYCLEQRVLVNVTQERVVRLLPPLIIDKQQADLIVDAVCGGIATID